MPAPKAVPATPPTFHLKMRLVDAEGTAFAGKDYQLWWGGKMVKDGQTDADGAFEADVDDDYDTGLLDLGQKVESSFFARLTIPIECVPPPPPPPKPFTPPEKKTAPPKQAPNPDGTDPSDPEPPMPIAPSGGLEDPKGWQLYQQQKQDWEDWDARRAKRQREAEQQKRDEEDEQRRKEGDPAKPKGAPAPPMSDEQRRALDDKIQRARVKDYEAKVLAYELSWRLQNLGYLPLVPSFPIDGLDFDWLLAAEQRYAHKNELSIPSSFDVVAGDDSPVMKELSEKIKAEHDG